MSNHREFLKFEGYDILYVSKNGENYVALRPICNALGVSARRSVQTAKKHAFYGPECTEQCIQVSKNGQKQGRYMTCLPEHLIYMWISTLSSQSPDFVEYQKTCAKLLSDYFHGEIGDRKNMVEAMLKEESELKPMKNELGAMSLFIEIKKKEKKVKAYKEELKRMDMQMVKDSNLFS